MVDGGYELHAFEGDGEERKPFYLQISPPSFSLDLECYFCSIHAPSLFTSDKRAHGIDADQARSLAIRLVEIVLDGRKIVDSYGEPIDWDKVSR